MKKKPQTDSELIYAFASGLEELRYTSVVMTSRNFAIFRIAGHSSWSGVSRPWEYVKAQHFLIRRGVSYLGREVQYRRWEGRIAKATLKEALRRSEILKEPYSGDFAPMCEECDVEMNYGEGQEGGKLVKYYRCDDCGWSVDA